MVQNGYLDFVEDKFVPDAVLPDDPIPHFSIFPFHSEIEQPLLEGRLSSTLHLVIGYLMTPHEAEEKKAPGRS